MNRPGIALLTALVLPAGCGKETAAPRSSGEGAGARTVDLRVVDAAGFEDVLASHRGRVVLVDFWATWCAPCVKQFPHTVELGRRYAKKGLAVISFSVDDTADEDAVRGFLEKQGATFDNLMTKFGLGTRTVEEFGLPTGAVPFYRLYDRRGQLRHQFSGDPDGIENCEPIEKIDQRVEELLASA